MPAGKMTCMFCGDRRDGACADPQTAMAVCGDRLPVSMQGVIAVLAAIQEGASLRARRTEAALEAARSEIETLRPVWAQGWSTDSLAAQASAAALGQIWKALGVDNQTAAMARLKELGLEGPSHVRVRPLDWVSCADGSFHDSGCLYEITPEGSERRRYWRLTRAVTGGGGYLCDCSSLEAAKAAAQDHHAARIRGAIEMPALSGGAAPDADVAPLPHAVGDS